MSILPMSSHMKSIKPVPVQEHCQWHLECKIFHVSCVIMDDERNILPISSHMKSIKPVPVQEDSEWFSEAERELKNLKEQLNDNFPVDPLIRKCCTLDQGKALVTCLDAILDKSLCITVALHAVHDRKSAALGLAIGEAIAAGYEGTGRSLSLKLLQQLEEQTQTSTKTVEGSLSSTSLLPLYILDPHIR